MSKIDNEIHDRCLNWLRGRRGPQTVVCVGAFTGKHSLAYGATGALVYAIEACPKNFGLLQKATAGRDNIIPRHVAITSVDGPVILHVAEHPRVKGSSQSNSLFYQFFAERKWAKPQAVTVPGVTLDTFISMERISEIDLLRLNCEGCEYCVFDAPTRSFLRRTKRISISMHGKSAFFTSEAFLKRRCFIMEAMRMCGFQQLAGGEDYRTTGHLDQLWEQT